MPSLPLFTSEEEEADFWDTHSFADYWDELTPVELPFVARQSDHVLLALRLDRATLEGVRALATARQTSDIALIRLWVEEHLAQEQPAAMGGVPHVGSEAEVGAA